MKAAAKADPKAAATAVLRGVLTGDPNAGPKHVLKDASSAALRVGHHPAVIAARDPSVRAPVLAIAPPNAAPVSAMGAMSVAPCAAAMNGPGGLSALACVANPAASSAARGGHATAGAVPKTRAGPRVNPRAWALSRPAT